MKKKVKSLIYIFCLIVVLIIPYFVFATSPLENLKSVRQNSGYADVDETGAASLAGSIVKVFFSILGIIFIVLMLYGGYNWMIAAGDNAKVEKAKDTIKRAVIGLIIVVSAWAIYIFISIYIIIGQ
ncbi:MAG: hypothetical protein NTW06_02155 [Candidatus Falkowbacteria bacterium]|nr:hypothetical protein [Candidatus Falkowbacteria bacterium]